MERRLRRLVMNIQVIPKLIKLFYNSNKKWKLPSKVDILIYNNAGSELLIKYFNNYSFSILDTSSQTINVPILFRAAFNYKQYFNKYIYHTNPKVVITYLDNNRSFYLLKIKNPKIITIFIQNGVRSYSGDIFEILLNDKKNINYFVDYMLCFNESIAKKYKEYINGESLIIGSFKNNMVPINTNFFKNNKLVYISQYRRPNPENNILFNTFGREVLWTDFYSKEVKLLPILLEYCNKQKIAFEVCGCESDSVSHEITFYNQIFNSSDWVYIPRTSSFSSYEIIDNASFIVTIDSTLGLEALIRNKRVAFFSDRNLNLPIDESDIKWPNNNKTGPFWSVHINEKEISRVLDFIFYSSDELWHKEQNFIRDKVLSYDQGNLKFKQLLQNIIEKK